MTDDISRRKRRPHQVVTRLTAAGRVRHTVADVPNDAEQVSCLTCEGREQSDWCALGGEDLAHLDRAQTCRNVTAGELLFHQGHPCEGIYCLKDGIVSIRKVGDDGSSMIVRLAWPGETLGYRSYFSGERYRACAEALSPSRVCFIGGEALEVLVARNPALARRFLARLAVDLREAEAERLRAASHPLRDRLVELLLRLGSRLGHRDASDELRFELPLSRQDLAAILGTRPETIARAVAALERSGFGRFDGRQVAISDCEAQDVAS